jgi:tripartite-type tricarboxylate transporter receptor subunit TctC
MKFTGIHLKTHHRAAIVVLGGLLAAWSVQAGAAAAQAFPTKPIRVIVPQSAGGSTDLAARLVTQRMAEGLHQNIVIDNRPGAGSLHGTELVARAAPDGYTLLVVAASFSINPSLHKKLSFDPIRDFAPITQIAALPHVLVLHPSVPAKSVKELISLVKAKPGYFNYGSSGIATSTHLAAELFRHMTGTEIVHVPYKGGAPGVMALLGGQVHLYFATISTAFPHIKAGKLRALAVTSSKRSVAAPEFPTLAESGVPGYHHASWIGMLAPAKTPQPVIARLNGESAKVIHSQEVKTLLLRDGLETVGESPGHFGALIKAEVAKWLKVVAAAGIQAN